jgi:hypothetical protein
MTMNLPVHRPPVPQHITLNSPLIGALLAIGNAEIEYRIHREALRKHYALGHPLAQDDVIFRDARDALVRAATTAWEDVKAARAQYEGALEAYLEELANPIPF